MGLISSLLTWGFHVCSVGTVIGPCVVTPGSSVAVVVPEAVGLPHHRAVKLREISSSIHEVMDKKIKSRSSFQCKECEAMELLKPVGRWAMLGTSRTTWALTNWALEFHSYERPKLTQSWTCVEAPLALGHGIQPVRERRTGYREK